MAVIPKSTEPKCKLCRHPQRAEIDALLEKRAQRVRDEDGKFVYTQEVVLRTLGEWGVENPTLDNIKGHWSKHCEMVEDGTAEAMEAAAMLAVKDLLAEGEHADVDDTLRSILTIGRARLLERLAKGDNPITIDQMLKAADALTRRSHSQAQRDVLDALTGGIAQALGGAKQPKQLGPVSAEGRDVVLEGVVVEVEELVG